MLPLTPSAPCALSEAPQEAPPPADDLLRWMKFAGSSVTIASFAGFDEQDRFLVRLVATEAPAPAVSAVALSSDDTGVQVVIAMQDGDARRPIILGRLQERRTHNVPLVKTDGERLVFKAEREIELRCGDASIVLTRSGKVLIKGAYVLTRSSGANRIKGAYVEIN
jgi:Domain of unknown function (DUF6484)